jgi:four helix bundle protein
MAFQRFEDIIAWQKARALNKRVYEITKTVPFSKDFTLCDQIRRSSISIIANIAEGFGRHSNKEFANFLNIARGSAFEVQCHLYIALDVEYIDQITFDPLYANLDEICRMLYSLRQRLLENPR